MMGQPTSYQLNLHLTAHPGARVVNPSGSSQGPPVPVNQNDIIPAIAGWHVVLRPHSLPWQGYPLGYSDDNVHYSLGPSTTGAGVPGTQLADGRMVSADGTIGGTPGAAGSGSGGGSSQRGY